jgi:phage shock protein PspC (stress-responsive transcriptional regulator)
MESRERAAIIARFRVTGRQRGNPPPNVNREKEPIVARPMSRTLTRPRDGRIIAGVCAGLADRFGWSVFLVRLLFLVSIILPGSQVVVYLILWLMMPNREF